MTDIIVNPATNNITLFVNEGIPGNVTESGTQTLSNKTLNAATFTGNTIINGPLSTNITSVPSSDINCSLGNYFIKSINSNTTFTFSNAPGGVVYAFTLEVTHVSGTITWPASVRWPNSVAPELIVNKTHLFIFITDDAGLTWRGATLINYTN